MTDLYLSNPAAASAASVSSPSIRSTDRAPPSPRAWSSRRSRAARSRAFLLELFGLTSGQGSLFLDSSSPVAAAIRVGARTAGADYAGFAPAIDGAAGIANGSAIAIGLPQTQFRRTNLLLFNRGFAGSVTVTGFRADGSEAGSSSRWSSATTRPAAWTRSSPRSESRISRAGAFGSTVPDGMNVYAWTAEVDALTGDVDLAAVP